jgi:hypothetical protein
MMERMLDRMPAMEQPEPPSTRPAVLRRRLFQIGRDSLGHWVAQDRQGLCGGLFVDRAQALKFAKSENGNCADAVIIVPGIIELDMSNKSQMHSKHIGTEALRAD